MVTSTKHEFADEGSEHSFRQLAESIGAVFRLVDLDENRVLYVSRGYEDIWGRPCEALYTSTRAWYETIHPEDCDRVLDAVMVLQKRGGYDEEYRIVRPDGGIRWVRDRAFPVRNQAGEIHRIAAMAENITQRRLLERELVEINDRERSDLGRDLHDGICQQLVSIAFATDLLRRDLVAKSPGEAVRAARITTLLDNAISQARSLSNALCPMNLAGDGLAVALRELAAGTNNGSGISCHANCSEAVYIHEAAIATHLYRIAQEAVQNAVKNGHATRIDIGLTQRGNTVRLSISDNGPVHHEEGENHFDIGLSVIKFRANMAGGRLEIGENPDGGTMISCSIQEHAAQEISFSPQNTTAEQPEPIS